MESVAARRRPRGCYECWPGMTRQRLWNLLPLGDAQGNAMDGCGLVQPGRLQNLSLLNPSIAGQIETFRCYRGCYLSIQQRAPALKTPGAVYLYPPVRLVATETILPKSGTKPLLHMV